MSQITRRQFVLATSAMLVPNAALTQSTQKFRLGLLKVVPLPPLTDPFFQALRERGWVAGRNLDVETRATESDPARALALARELVEQGVDVLVTVTTANARAAREASRSVPIVMLASGYPVESGLAASLARPGGNVTGLASYAGTGVWGKYVAFLRELVPSLREMGVFLGYAPPAYAQTEVDLVIDEMRRAAELLNIRTHFWMTGTVGHFDVALKAAENSAIAALLVSGGGAIGHPDVRARLGEFTARRRMPTISDVTGVWFNSEFGLIAYTPDFKELGVRAASFVDRILRGAKPADLPIELPTKFELVINMKTAKVLGIKIPQSFLVRADRVIE